MSTIHITTEWLVTDSGLWVKTFCELRRLCGGLKKKNIDPACVWMNSIVHNLCFTGQIVWLPTDHQMYSDGFYLRVSDVFQTTESDTDHFHSFKALTPQFYMLWKLWVSTVAPAFCHVWSVQCSFLHNVPFCTIFFSAWSTSFWDVSSWILHSLTFCRLVDL